ncbi:hypothetical protein INT43_007634 [Umbelopsis isabellina]|uniref:F-box domain-containing protein n=1 Tax=Mortierella isabellina TaxID=91625 RepID=A0A8H7PNG4_MORIS|nr:hypothetical protein INT43_007634 [Umbelopsis isabellina]
MRSLQHDENPSDEGYVEQGFETPVYMKHWTNEQKAEFAYQLLLTVPTSGVLAVVERLTPLLHKDLLALLPYEVSLHILSFTDINTLTSACQVSRQWRKLSQDQLLWRKLYFIKGWSVDQMAIKRYIGGETAIVCESSQEDVKDMESIDSESTSSKALTAVPLARTTAPLYNPSAVPTMPGTPQASRLHSLRRPGELLTRLRHRRSSPLTPSLPGRVRHSGSSSSLTARLQPDDPSSSMDEDMDEMDASSDQTVDSEELVHEIHRHPITGARMINWKHLYQQRYLLEQRWSTGNYKLREISSGASRQDAHTAGIYCIQFDDQKIVSGSRDHTIKIWDIGTGACIRTLWQHTQSVLCLQYDDRYIISGSSDNTIKQWDINTGELIRSLNGHTESVLNLRFNEKYIVSCSKDRTVRVWDVNTGALVRRLIGHRAAVNACQFNDNLVVSASGDRTIKLWDIETGECLRTFDSHSRGIACVQFDGHIIVSGSSDQTIKVWDAASGECLQTLTGHSSLVRTVQFDSKADRIVSGSYDESIKIWSMKRGQQLLTLRDQLQSK